MLTNVERWVVWAAGLQLRFHENSALIVTARLRLMSSWRTQHVGECHSASESMSRAVVTGEDFKKL